MTEDEGDAAPDSDRRRDGAADASQDLPPDDVYEAMEPLEPYTTGELATRLRASTERVRSRLASLVADERVRKKEPGDDVVLWIREPPAYTCPDCGDEFQVRFLHPVLSSVRICPHCGAQLD